MIYTIIPRFENYTASITVDGRTTYLNLWDEPITSDDMDRIRPLCYPQTDVFLVCFSIVSPPSLEHVRTKWYEELSRLVPNVPRILVGTKSDLREDTETIEKLREKGMAPVTHEQAMQMMEGIGAVQYLECSALSQTGVKELFDEAVRVAFASMRQKAKKKCILL